MRDPVDKLLAKIIITWAIVCFLFLGGLVVCALQFIAKSW